MSNDNNFQRAGHSMLRTRLMVFHAIVFLAAMGVGDGGRILGQDVKADSGAVPSITVVPKKSNSAAKSSKKSADQKASDGKTEFLRVLRDDSGNPKSMQTAITRYRPAKGDYVVDLIGAVHIGEGEYYELLNQQFDLYDVVLYELVAPEGTRVPRGGKKSSRQASPMGMISWMQKKAQTSLGLESQLEKIDYQKLNFTHADMSPTDIGKKMAERGETPFSIGLSAFSEMMRQGNRPAGDSTDASGASMKNRLADSIGQESLFEVLGNPLKMKQMMAGQFAQTGALDSGLGSTLNQLLVTDRNAAAIKVMEREIANGKTKIAIFYGAAHMADFEKRLVEEFGMKKTKQVWVDAWDLTTAPAPEPASKTSSLLMKILDELGK